MNANFLPTPTHAESAFYKSFSECDVETMASIWGPDDVVCVHPGSTALVGHERVVKSWQHILGHGGSVTLRNELLSEFSDESIAVHVVRETLSGAERDAIVIATNVYQRYSQGWKIVAHHATPPMLERSASESTRPSGVTLQ